MALLVSTTAKLNKAGVTDMKHLVILSAIVLLQGCSTVQSVKDWIPSRWDVNQAKVITDLRQQTYNFDCKQDQPAQLKAITANLQWFQLYSESKGTKDVNKLLDTMRATVKEFSDRPQPVSAIYCDIKKKVMIQQVDIAAKTVQGRF
jgi:hypothetical protein